MGKRLALSYDGTEFEALTDPKWLGFVIGQILSNALKYTEKGKKVISGLKRISKPGLRIYASKEELPRVLNGLGIALISTSKGIMTDKKARELGVGGEVLAYIW